MRETAGFHGFCSTVAAPPAAAMSRYFYITVLYYNPNIFPPSEYALRVREQESLISRMDFVYPVAFLEGSYRPETFYEAVKGLEGEPEGGKRCEKCYELRLLEAAKEAKAGDYDYFTTTLTISPLKSADKLNEIGRRLGTEYGVAYLPSDFKKRDGYKRSTQLSKEYGLYRQDYCGCVYSVRERSGE